MNFYEFYKLLNEYGQTLIDSLITKFKKENPGLSPTVIRSYIDRFERIKNNLPEKDITKYSWEELESAVDGYGGQERIKAGRLDPTVTDANLLYNKGGVRIYLGKDKKSCIRYSNGYTFCIGARGPKNLYTHYRIARQGTPYFIFNDNLPSTDNRHLMVLFVYKKIRDYNGLHATNSYSITLADNKGDTKFSFIDDIIRKYPWVSPIKTWVDNNGHIEGGVKGSVPIDPAEFIEHLLTSEYERKKYLFLNNYADTLDYEFAVSTSLLRNQTKHVKQFLENKKKLASVNIFLIFSYSTRRPERQIRDPYESIQDMDVYFLPYNGSEIFVFYDKPETVIKKIENEVKEACLQVMNEYSPKDRPYGGSDLPNLEETKKMLKEKEGEFKKILAENQNFALDSVDLEKMKVGLDVSINFDNENGIVILPYFLIALGSPTEKAKKDLLENKEKLNKILEMYSNYTKQLSWVNSAPKEILDRVVDQIKDNGGNTAPEYFEEDDLQVSVSEIINSFMG